MPTRRAVLPLVAALALAGCLGAVTESPAPVDQRAPGAWTTLPALGTPRQEVAVAAAGGRVYVVGGFGRGAEPVPTVEAYDPVANAWQPRAPFPVPVHHAAAAVVDDRLFVVGGYSGGRVRWIALDTVYEYVAARDAWVARARLGTARGALAAATLDGRLHALGGSDGSPSDAHEVYDPASDRWTRFAALPTPRDHLAAVAFQGRLWAIGGRSSFMGTQYATVDIYDPATAGWSPGVPLPTGRGGIAAAALPDRILVFGGEAPLRIFNSVEMFEPAGNRWISKEPMPTPRHGAGAAVAGARIVVAAGGTEPGFAPSTAVEAYTP